MRKFYALILSLLLFAASGLAQTTVTINCTGTAGSYNSGYVTNNGFGTYAKVDGNLQVIGNGSLRRGWAGFDLSSIPAGSTINSATLKFYVYSTTLSGVSNNIYGFTGNPQTMNATTLYNNCGGASSSTLINANWSLNANSLTLNAAGISFIQNNLVNNFVIGFWRGNASAEYDIYGYPGSSAQQPQLVINYTPPAYVVQFSNLSANALTPWCPGETRSISITVKNLGSASWLSGATGVNFSYWWSNQSGRDANARILPFTTSLASGQSQILTFNVTAPANGTPILNFDLVREQSCWFADNVSGCSGPGNSVYSSSSVTINSISPPTGTTPQIFCATSNPTVANLSATGTNIQWYAAASGGSPLPSTTALVNGTHYYASQTNASGCQSSTRLDVTANVISAPVTVTYSANPATYCAGQIITANTPTTTSGGAPTSYSVNPALPAGLSLNTTTGVITGNPTTTAGVATTTYTVTASNSCGATTAAVSITINPAAPSLLNYATTSASYCLGTPIPPNNPSNSGGAATGYSVSPALPSGLSIDPSTGIISGTPGVVSGSATYIVTASNSCGSTTKQLTIAVTSAPVTVSYSANPATYCAGQNIIANTPTTTSGGIPTSYSVSPALPAGLSLSTTTGVITGNPSTATGVATTTYTLTATNSCGSTTTGVSITISPAAPSSLNYATTSANYCLNTPITANIPSNSGGAPTNYTISPALSTGLSINPSTGVISGTPTAVTPSTNYTITASNSCGSTTQTISILVSSVGSWIGITSTDWFTPSNWGCGGVPTQTTDVTIPSSAPNMPNINGTGAVCQSITNNGTLTITGTNNLDVYGDWINNSTFTGNTSSVTFRGGSGNIIAGTAATTFGNLIVNKSATANTLTSNSKAFSAGNLTVTTGNIILKADDNDYTFSQNVTVSLNGTLTHSVAWDANNHKIGIGGNLMVTGIFNPTVRSHVQLNGNGAYTLQTGSNPASTLSILTLLNGTFTASGTLKSNQEAWVMFGSAGSFSTNGNDVTFASIYNNQGTINVNTGGSLTVNGPTQIGYSGTVGAMNISAGTVNLNGDFIIGTSGTVTCSNSPTINITGNWTNNKTFTAASSQVNFTGTTAQTIGGGATTTFNNLKINNAAGISLGINTNVSNILDLTSGLITTGTNTITSSSTSATAITNYNASSYVNGKLARNFATGASSKIFPIGAGGNYKTLTFAYTASSQASTITVQQIESTIPGTVTPSTVTPDVRYWQITKTGSGSSSYYVTLDPTYTPSPAGSLVQIIKKEGTSNALTATAATTPNYTNSSAFTTFNNITNGTNGFALGADCSSSANAGAALPAICQGGTSAALGGSISGTATGGTWTDGGVGGIFNPNSSTLNATWTPPATFFGTATLTLTPTGGVCSPSTTASKTILVNGDATIALTSAAGTTSQTICINKPIAPVTYLLGGGATGATLSGQPTGIGGSYNSSTKVYTISGTPTVSGAFTFTVTTTGPCAKPTSGGTITVTPDATISLTSATGTDNQTVCSNVPITNITYAIGGSATNATVTGLPTGVTAVYSGGVVTISGTPGQSGTFNYTVATSGPCVQPSVTGTISSLAIPAGTFTASATTICSGTTVTFTATGGNSYTFYVNGSVVQGPGATNIFSTSSLSNGNVVTVHTSNSNNCGTTYNPITMTVNPPPVVTLNPTSSSICPGTSVTFTATGGSGSSGYIFLLNGNAIQSGASNTYTTTTLNNNDKVAVMVNDANSCSATFSPAIVMTVNSLPTGSLTSNPASAKICAGDNIVFTATSGFDKYEFFVNSVSQGVQTGNTFSSTGLTNPSTVTVTATNTSGCSASFNPIGVTVNPLPTGSITTAENSGNTNDNLICSGASVRFTATPGFTNYKFYLRTSTTLLQGGASNVFQSTSLVDGDYVTVVVTNSNGCINSAPITSATIQVSPSPTGTLSVSPSNTICANVPVIFTATSGYSTYNFKINGASIQMGSGNTFAPTVGTLHDGDIVSVDVSNANTCVTTFNTITMKVNALPSGTLNITETSGTNANDATICAGAPVTFTAPTGFTNYNFLLNGSTAPGQGETNVYTTSTLANNDQVTVSVTNAGGCAGVLNTYTMVVNPLPAISPITGTMNVCVNSITSLADGTSGGTWSSSDPTIATIDASGQVTGVKAGTVTILYTTVPDASGCTNSASATVTVNALPALASILGGAPAVCVGSTTPAFTETTGGGTWSTGDNTIATINASGIVTGVAPGTITVIYTTAANANGCISTTSVPLTVNAVPVVAAIGGGKTEVCVGGIANFTDATSGGVWSVTNGSGSATIDAAMGILKGVSPGTVILNYTVTNASGCSTTVSTGTININALPVPTLSGPNPICPGAVDTYTTEDGMMNYTWNVTGGNITGGDPATHTITVTWNTSGPYSIYVNYTNASGCSGATSATVTSNTGTVPTLDGDKSVCLNSDGSYVTQNGMSNYMWTVNGGTISSGGTGSDNTATVTWNTAGPRSVSINFADANGCVAAVPFTLPVTVHPLPKATIAGTIAVCENSSSPSVTFTGAAGTAPYTFTYNINSGSNVMVTTTSGNSITVPVATGTAGSFAYNLVSVSDANGCTQSQSGTATVTVTPTPSATISYDGGPFCTTAGPVSVTFSGTTGGSYSSTSGLTIDPSSGQITPSTSTGGVYTVTYTVAAAGGCSVYTTTAQVTITAAPSATISYAGGPFCTTASPVSVTFSGTPGGTYSSTSGLTIDPSSGQITPSTSTGGSYVVTYTIAASGNCASFSTTTNVTITQAPSASISYTGTPFCTTAGSTPVNFTGTTGGTFSVLPAGLTIDGLTGAINPSTSTPGTYTVTYTIAAANGCAAITPTASVVINAAPTAVAGTALTMCANVPSVNVTAGAGATKQSSVTWTSSGTGTFANANSLTTATYTPSLADITAGSVTLTLTANGNGSCAAVTSTKTLTISAIPTISVVPTTAIICQGSIQALTATSTGNPAPYSQPFPSNPINITIQDAKTGYRGTITPGEGITSLPVSGIPAGAVITNITVSLLNVNETSDGDLIINVKAPNGATLNLVNRKGGNGSNFTNTAIAWNGTSSLGGGTAPFTGTFAPDAATGLGYNGYVSNVSNFSGLTSQPNGTWTLYAADVNPNGSYGAITSWSVKIDYTIPVSNPVSWSPSTDLYTDAAATTPYTGQPLTTVYAMPSTSGTKVYTATATNVSGCTSSAQATLSVSTTPVVSLSADYCLVPGKVVIKATSIPAATSYAWSTGGTKDTIQVITADNYSVTVSAGGCPGTGNITVAQNLVVNGDFESGDVGFTTPYISHTHSYYNGNTNSGLYPEGYYAVDNIANSPRNGVGYHPMFWGQDHTSGSGNFMMINGAGNNPQLKVWKETINILPNTTYYFSAWGLSLNNVAPFAQLQFNINDAQVGTIGYLPAGVNSNNNGSPSSGSPWTQFYGTWTSGPTTTVAVISITDLQTAPGGNDFGLDDINFGTLSPFIHLVSAAGTDGQTLCVNTPITPIVYSVGSTASGPVLSAPLPAGLTGAFTPGSGLYTITGTPTVAGNFSYTLTTTGSCNPTSATGTVTVQRDKITLSSGNASPSICTNTGVNIGFTLSGTAIGVTSDSTKIPPGFTGTLAGSTYTITGQSATPGVYPYTIVTSGGCTSDTARGTITVTAQSITLNSGNDNQTVCINTNLNNIQYTVGGTGTNATVSGLPTGVTYSVNSGIVFISGIPSVAGSFTYTVTTSGTCQAATVQGTIKVTPAASLVLTSTAGTDNQTDCINTNIADITYSVNNATTATVTGLPAGVNGSVAAGIFKISGMPTVAGIFNYTVTTTDGCGTATASGTITVRSQTITLTNGSSSPTVCENAPLATPIVFTIGGTANGASTSGLPAGMAGTLVGNTYTIGGTPTQSGTFNYTVTVTGSCSTNATTNGTITVTAASVGGTIASVAVCGGSSGTLTLLNYSGTIDHWETSTDQSTWTNIANGTINQAYTNVMTTTYYRAALTTTCGQVYSTTAKIAIHNLWTGATNTDWNTGSNWSDGNVASTICSEVYIPATSNQPILSSGTGTITNLHIYASATLTVTNAIMQIGGTINNAGNFDASNGTLEFNGATPQTFSGSLFNGNKVENLIVSNNSLTIVNDPNHLNDTLKISGVVSFGKGTAQLNTGDNLTLQSTKNNTASIGTLGANNAVSGQVEIERYINIGPGGHAKTWQFLSTPTLGQSFKQSWMESGIKTSTGYGAQFTGTSTSTGYDGSSPAPSVKFWDESIGTWKELANTGSALYNKRGYFAFIRGNRSVDGRIITASNPTTLRSKGTIFTGNQQLATPIQTPDNVFYSIGNPYPSAVDMTKVMATVNTKTDKLPFYYVWNASKSDDYYNVGSWNTYVLQLNGHYQPVPDDGSGTDFLQSGQAFLIQVDQSYPTVVNFTENDKVSQSSIIPFRGGSVAGKPVQIITNLLSLKADGTTSLTDGTLQQFDNANNPKIDRYDAKKIMNSANNLSIKSSGANLVVERRTLPTQQDTIQYNMANMQAQNYRLEFKAEGLSAAGVDGFVEDTYSNTRTPLNMEGTTDVNFAITSDKATSAASRFRIVFKTAVVLPVKLISVTAVQKEANIVVDWKVENEQTVKQYDVEKSIDGVNFKPAYNVAAGNTGAGSYEWPDQQVTPGNNYYRIRITDKSGQVSYSSVVMVMIPLGKPSIGIYPNPITDGVIHVQFVNQPKGRYGIRLLNPLGQTIVSRQISHDGGNATENIQWDYNLAHGVYQLEVLKPDGKTEVIKVMY